MKWSFSFDDGKKKGGQYARLSFHEENDLAVRDVRFTCIHDRSMMNVLLVDIHLLDLLIESLLAQKISLGIDLNFWRNSWLFRWFAVVWVIHKSSAYT